MSKIKVKKQRKVLIWEKIVIAVAVAILLVIFFLLIVTGVGLKVYDDNLEIAKTFDKVIYEQQLVPQTDTDGYTYFVTDKEFKILDLSDIHLGGGWLSADEDKMALNAVAAMITAEKPDLVMVTGDLIFPLPFTSGTSDNERSSRLFAELMESLGVYWALCFGNHDVECYSGTTREELGEIYSEPQYEHCLFQVGSTDITGVGNYVIKVKNSKGIVTQALVVMDSNSYLPNDPFGAAWKYDSIHQDQIDWYENEINRLNADNKAIDSSLDMIKSLTFFHIPLTEYRDAYLAKDSDPETKYFYGNAGEVGKIVFGGDGKDQLFETMQKLKSTQGIFCGHDHLNNFSIEYKGIRLTYAMSIDYLAYSKIDKIGAQRGCTIIKIQPDGSFDCKAENYYQDKYVPRFAKESVQDTTAKKNSEISNESKWDK